MEIKGPIQVVHRYVKMPGQKAEFYNETSKETIEVETCQPAMGYSFAAGTTDGPGSFSFSQGTTTTNPVWDAVRNFVAAPTPEDIKCHGAKPILLATGRVNKYKLSLFFFLFFKLFKCRLSVYKCHCH